MSLFVQGGKSNSYDDSKERKTWEQYCKQKGYEVEFYNKYDPLRLDCCIKTLDGKYIIIELICNSCWTDQKEYPEDFIHIPVRKFDYFKQVINGISVAWHGGYVATCDQGYVILFNKLHTRMARISFRKLIRNEQNFTKTTMTFYKEPCPVCLVPKEYTKEYKDIM